MSPGGELWALLVLWACSYFLGETFDSIGLPKALGSACAAATGSDGNLRSPC